MATVDPQQTMLNRAKGGSDGDESFRIYYDLINTSKFVVSSDNGCGSRRSWG